MKTLKLKWLSLLLTAAVLPLNSSGAALSGPDRGIPQPENTAPTTEERAILALSATELARRIAARELTSVQVVRAFVGQIARHNVTYNAIVLLDLDAALERAKAADEALARGNTVQIEHFRRQSVSIETSMVMDDGENPQGAAGKG